MEVGAHKELFTPPAKLKRWVRFCAIPIIILATIVRLRFQLLLGFDCYALLDPIDKGFVKG